MFFNISHNPNEHYFCSKECKLRFIFKKQESNI